MIQKQVEQAAREHWLNFFNQVLYERKMLSQGEYLAMARSIKAK